MPKPDLLNFDDDILVFDMDNIVEYKDFRDIAQNVVAMVKKVDMDAEIRHPKFIIEVERGTSVAEVMEAYQQVLDLLKVMPKTQGPKKRGFGPKL